MTSDQFKLMADSIKQLGWDIDASKPQTAMDAQIVSVGGVTTDMWNRVSEIIVNIEKIDKDGGKLYEKLQEMPGHSRERCSARTGGNCPKSPARTTPTPPKASFFAGCFLKARHSFNRVSTSASIDRVH